MLPSEKGAEKPVVSVSQRLASTCPYTPRTAPIMQPKPSTIMLSNSSARHS